MKVFIFYHPEQSLSEGMWVVRAEDEQHAGVLAWVYFENPRLGLNSSVPVEAFQQAALEGQSLELVNHGEPMVLECFLT
jgi:hypothetical protein